MFSKNPLLTVAETSTLFPATSVSIVASPPILRLEKSGAKLGSVLIVPFTEPSIGPFEKEPSPDNV